MSQFGYEHPEEFRRIWEQIQEAARAVLNKVGHDIKITAREQ